MARWFVNTLPKSFRPDICLFSARGTLLPCFIILRQRILVRKTSVLSVVTKVSLSRWKGQKTIKKWIEMTFWDNLKAALFSFARLSLDYCTTIFTANRHLTEFLSKNVRPLFTIRFHSSDEMVCGKGCFSLEFKLLLLPCMKINLLSIGCFVALPPTPLTVCGCLHS